MFRVFFKIFTAKQRIVDSFRIIKKGVEKMIAKLSSSVSYAIESSFLCKSLKTDLHSYHSKIYINSSFEELTKCQKTKTEINQSFPAILLHMQIHNRFYLKH